MGTRRPVKENGVSRIYMQQNNEVCNLYTRKDPSMIAATIISCFSKTKLKKKHTKAHRQANEQVNKNVRKQTN